MDIISILGTIIGLFISWASISIYRFQIYSIYEEIEKALTSFCYNIDQLEKLFEKHVNEHWTEESRSTSVKYYTKMALEQLNQAIGYTSININIVILRTFLLMLADDGYVVDGDFVKFETHTCVEEITNLHNRINLGQGMMKQILNAVRDEKKKLEKWNGNWKVFLILLQSKPHSKSSIIKNITSNLYGKLI